MDLVIGGKAKVRGRYEWFTDHMDGTIVSIEDLEHTNHTATVRDSSGGRWYVPIDDLTPYES